MESAFRFKVFGYYGLGNLKFSGTYIAPNMITTLKELKCDGYHVKMIEELEEVHNQPFGEENFEILR